MLDEYAMNKNLKEYQMDDLEDSESYEDEYEGFTIDDSSTANWAIQKIGEKYDKRDYYIDACKKEIERLKEKIAKEEASCERSTDFLLSKLNMYLDNGDVPTKKTKTQLSLKLPSGTIVRKLAKREIIDTNGETSATKIKENDELINFVKESSPEYLQVKETIKWGDFKKTLVITDDGDVTNEDGEYIECLSTVETLPKVSVKIDKE